MSKQKTDKRVKRSITRNSYGAFVWTANAGVYAKQTAGFDGQRRVRQGGAL